MDPVKKTGPTVGTNKWRKYQNRIAKKQNKQDNQNGTSDDNVHAEFFGEGEERVEKDPQFDDLQEKLKNFNGKPQQNGTFPSKKRSITQPMFRNQSWNKKSGNYIKFSSDSEEDEENLENMKKQLEKSFNYSEGNENDESLKNLGDDISLSTDDEEESEKEVDHSEDEMPLKKPRVDFEAKNESKSDKEKKLPPKTKNQKAADEAKAPRNHLKSNPFAEIDRKADEKQRSEDDEESQEEEVPLLNSILKTSSRYQEMDSDDETMDTASSVAEDYNDDEENIVENELDDLKELKKKIEDMPLAKALEMKEKLGLKLWEAVQNEKIDQPAMKSDDDSDKDSDDEAPIKSTTKRSKNAPREMSWKKPVSVLRNIDFAGSNHERRRFDPRFEKKSGEFIESEFVRDYGFLHEMQHNDLKALQTEMKKNKSNPAKYQKLKNASMKLKQKLASQQEKRFWFEAKAELKQKNIERMNSGLKPIFVSNKNLEKIVAEKRLQYQTAAGKGVKYEKSRQKRLQRKEGRKNVLGIKS